MRIYKNNSKWQNDPGWSFDPEYGLISSAKGNFSKEAEPGSVNPLFVSKNPQLASTLNKKQIELLINLSNLPSKNCFGAF